MSTKRFHVDRGRDALNSHNHQTGMPRLYASVGTILLTIPCGRSLAWLWRRSFLTNRSMSWPKAANRRSRRISTRTRWRA